MNARSGLLTGVTSLRRPYIARIAALIFAVTSLAAHAHPSARAREYNIIGVTEAVSPYGFTRESVTGVLRLEQLSDEFELTLDAERADLAAACSARSQAADQCSRTFVRNSTEARLRLRGTVDTEPTGIMTFVATQGTPSKFTGFRSIDADLVVLTLERAAGTMLLFATRRGAATSASLAPGRFALHARTATFPRAITARSGAWTSFASAMRNGSLLLAGSAFVARESIETMTSQLQCWSTASSCTTRGVLQSARTSDASLGSVHEAAGRVVLLQPASRWRGTVTPSGDLLAMLESSSSSTPGSLVLALRRPHGSSNASVQGTYNAVALEEFFDTDSGIRHARVIGPLDLDGANSWAFTGTDAATKRSECTGSDAAACGAGTSGRTVAGGAGGSYQVSADGDISLVGLAGDNTPREFIGSVSADGSLIVMRRVGDAVACSFDCVGQQSFRSIIVAVRR